MRKIVLLRGFGALLLGLLLLISSQHTPAISSQTSQSLAECWSDLASDDAAKAFRATWQLVEHPAASLKLLRENMKPAPSPDFTKIQAWLTDLSNPKFAIRDKAFKELTKQDELAEEALRLALKETVDLETSQRVQQLLDRLQNLVASAEKLQALRALEALELIGDKDAKALLRELAKGFGGDRLTREAGETLKRLEERDAVPHQPEIAPKGVTNGFDDSLPRGALYRLGTKLFRQEESSSSLRLAISPDGKVIASAGQNNFAGRQQSNIYFWEAQTGKLLSKKSIGASCLAFAPDGSVLAIGQASSKDGFGGIVLWDTAKDKELARTQFAGDGSADQLFYSPDGKELVCKIADKQGRKADLGYFDATSLKENKHWLPEEGTLNAVSPDGNYVVVQPKEGNSQIWNLQSGSKIPFFRFRSLAYTAFSADSKLLAGLGPFTTGFRIWDVATGSPLWVGVEHDFFLNRPPVFAADSKLFATSMAQFGPIGLWNCQTGAFLHELPESHAFGPAAISANSRYLAGVSGHTVRVWDLQAGKRITDGAGHFQNIERITFLPKLNAIATSARDGAVRIWDSASGKELKMRSFPVVGRLADCAVSPDGKLAAISDMDGYLNVMDIATGRVVYAFPGHGRLGLIKRPVQFSDDGRYLMSFSSNDSYLRKWDLKNGRTIVEERIRPSGMIISDDDDPESDPRKTLSALVTSQDCAFTRQGDQLVTVSSSGKVHFFDTATGKESHVKSHVIGNDLVRENFAYVSLSPTGKHFALLTQGPRITLYNWATGKQALSVDFSGVLGRATFSPDGRTLAVVADKKVNFVEVVTGKVRHVLELPAHCDLLTFSPLGRRFVTAFDDTTALVWDSATIAAAKQ
jgi:WD40 repeat protein